MPAQLSTTITEPTCNNPDFADPLGRGPDTQPLRCFLNRPSRVTIAIIEIVPAPTAIKYPANVDSPQTLVVTIKTPKATTKITSTRTCLE
jgi:hypothetical protein